MEIFPRPSRAQERERPEGTGHLMPTRQVFESLLVLSLLYPTLKLDQTEGFHTQSVQLVNDFWSSVSILGLDLYCQGHSEDLQFLNWAKLVNSLGLLCLIPFFFLFFLFPGVCLLCDSPL